MIKKQQKSVIMENRQKKYGICEPQDFFMPSVASRPSCLQRTKQLIFPVIFRNQVMMLILYLTKCVGTSNCIQKEQSGDQIVT